MTDSVLWTNSTIEKDRAMVRVLVRRYIGGGDEHREACVEKIMQTIQTDEWQAKFPKRNFVFYVYYSVNVVISEVRIGLLLQALDALYPYIALEAKRAQVKDERFASKIQQISGVLYGRRLNKGVSGAIEELRNRLLHTASFDGYISGEDDLTWFIARKVQPDNPQLGHMECVRFFARSMSPLVGEMALRALGLADDDVALSSTSPLWHPWFFKK